MPKSYNKFGIVVNPLGSLFAKTIQAGLQAKVLNKVIRKRHVHPLRNEFLVTPRSLNKVEQFERFHSAGVSCPLFCTSPSECGSLGTRTVFARTLINSTNGRGIVEVNLDDERDIPNAPLYTAYVPKRTEYRVHTFGGKVIDIQEKRKRREHDGDRNTRVRNINNGYVYCRDGLSPPDGIADLAIRATAVCGYQYGAVDIIYNEKRKQCYVLEVNSRPGLSGTTLDSYCEAIINTFKLTRKV
jgi:hypothetical protein